MFLTGRYKEMLPYRTLKSKELKKLALTIEFPQNICYDVLIRTEQTRNNVHLNIDDLSVPSIEGGVHGLPNWKQGSRPGLI